MPRLSGGRCARLVAALGVLLCVGTLGRSAPCGCLTLERLQKMSPDELADLFERADIGTPPVGKADGKLLFLTDRRPKMKIAFVNAVWRGKDLEDDGYFVNRFAGNVRVLDSYYVIGPSYVDGRPAVVMEYPVGTPLFERMRDEMREVAPGLYMGPAFERYPCRKFRGFVALQIDPCKPRCRHGKP